MTNQEGPADSSEAAGRAEALQSSHGQNPAQPKDTEEHLQVEAVGSGGLWETEMDAVQQESAILNLVLNARDTMPEGGRLTVKAANLYLDPQYSQTNLGIAPGQYVMISVSDTGTGMSTETRARAFEPFFTTKAVGQGARLGLSQVYGFVTQSGGQVKIYSELGEGTAVKGYLPRIAGGFSASVDEAPISATGTGGEVVLVTEDNPAVLEYVVAVLRDLKCQVLQVPDGKSALQILNDDAKADLLLSDIVMPGMNGRALADQARRLRPGLKVIFMTGYSQNGLVHQGHLDPGVHLIQKPLSQTQLANRIRDVVDEPVRAA